jgi:hypothetical protein
VGDLDEETRRFGLATTSGGCPTVGGLAWAFAVGSVEQRNWKSEHRRALFEGNRSPSGL